MKRERKEGEHKAWIRRNGTKRKGDVASSTKKTGGK